MLRPDNHLMKNTYIIKFFQKKSVAKNEMIEDYSFEWKASDHKIVKKEWQNKVIAGRGVKGKWKLYVAYPNQPQGWKHRTTLSPVVKFVIIISPDESTQVRPKIKLLTLVGGGTRSRTTPSLFRVTRVLHQIYVSYFYIINRQASYFY